MALLAVMMALGCATDTVARRKQEHLAAYSALPVSHQAAIDQGRLLHGMTTNAAYIAWGCPSEIVSDGSITTWIYREQEFKEHKHITIRGTAIPEEVKTPYARNVVRAKITFENGLLVSWSRTPPSSEEQFR
jgi:hypothetical protein